MNVAYVVNWPHKKKSQDNILSFASFGWSMVDVKHQQLLTKKF